MPRKTDAPKLVAQKVIEQIKGGEMPSIGRAMRETGYSSITSKKNTHKIKANPAYQREMKDFSAQMDELIQSSIEQMHIKKTKGSFRDHTVAVDTMKKLKALNDGNPTDINKIEVNWQE